MKDYIKPVIKAYNVKPTEVICGSPKEYDGPLGVPTRMEDNLTEDMELTFDWENI